MVKKDSLQCDLKVIPCLNYSHDMKYSLPVKPSPNLPNDQSINLYASLCFFEGTNISLGRGTENNSKFMVRHFYLKVSLILVLLRN